MSAARVSKPQPAPVPSLESGDVMSRAEFHTRYLLHPEIKKAELIEGVVFVSSPLKAKGHGDQDFDISTWLGAYRALNPAVRGSSNATVILDDGNEVQPDACLRLVEGGASTMTIEGYIQGPPELVVEIAGSSVSRDLHQKKSAYERNRVQEYLVWRVEDAAIDWFALEDGRYTALRANMASSKAASFPASSSTSLLSSRATSQSCSPRCNRRRKTDRPIPRRQRALTLDGDVGVRGPAGMSGPPSSLSRGSREWPSPAN